MTPLSERKKLRHLLVLKDSRGKRTIVLEEATYSLGRSGDNDIILYSLTVSRLQAILLRVPVPNSNQYQFRLMDGDLSARASTNGTWINGERCQFHDLVHGDEILFGKDVLVQYHALENLLDREFIESSEAEDLSGFFQSRNIPKGTITKQSPNISPAVSESILARMASFPELIPSPIVEVDFQGGITYMNPAAVRLFPSLKQLGKHHPLLKDVFSGSAAKQTNSFQSEFTIDGCQYLNTFQVIPSSEIIRLFAQDITAQKQMERERNRRDQFLREVIAVSELSYGDRILRLLQLGCDWFNGQGGTVYRAKHHQFTVLQSYSHEKDVPSLSVGYVFRVENYQDCPMTQCLTETLSDTYFSHYNPRQRLSLNAPLIESAQGTDPQHQYFGSPIYIGQKLYGILAFTGEWNDTTDPIHPEEYQLIQLMTQWLGQEQERQISQDRLRIQLQRTTLFKQIIQQIHHRLDINYIFKTVVESLGQSFQVSRCVFHFWGETTPTRLPVVAEYTQTATQSLMDWSPPLVGNVHAQQVIQQGHAIAINETLSQSPMAPDWEIYANKEIFSMLSVRTICQDQCLGIISLHQCDEPRFWRTEEIEFLEALAVQVGVAMGQALHLENEKKSRKEFAKGNQALSLTPQKAEAENLAQCELLATINPEILTTMNAIFDLSSHLMNTPLTEQQAHLAKTIRESGETLLNLISKNC